MNILKKTASLALLLVSAGLSCAEEVRPNILFIFTDDQMPTSIRAYGNEIMKTPNLDRLAAQGALFEHAYNQGSFAAAICVASRTMINTGSSVWKAAQYTAKSDFYYGANQPTVGEMYTIERKVPEAYWSEFMKRKGYTTYMTGKWHVQIGAHKVFDYTDFVKGGMPNQTKARTSRKFIEGEPDTWSPYDPKFGGFWKGGTHWSEVQANRGIDFINTAAEKDEPFFIYVSFSAPHDPRQAPKEYIDMYPLEEIEVPANMLGEYPYNEYSGAGRKLRDEQLAPFPRTEYAVKKNLQEYYAIVSHMDTHIGRVLDALEASGKADNTYIFMTSDHGLAVGDHGYIGKQNQYESSTRVPLLAAGPSIKSGQRIESQVYLQDIMPTTLELAGYEEMPEQVDFKSLIPLLKGETDQSAYDALYNAYFSTQRSVRTDKYKMIIYPAANKVRLYDMQNDPLEMDDLAEKKEQHIELLNTMLIRLQKLQKEFNDPIDASAAFHNFMNNVPTPALEEIVQAPRKK